MKNVAAAISLIALTACGVETNQPPKTMDEVPVLNALGYETAGAFLSCLEGEAVLVSAHRGGPMPGYPENAIETFDHVLSMIPALMEVDVRETSDGVLVLLHDDTVDRTTDGRGLLADMTLSEVKALRLKDNNGRLTDFQVPTLDEALTAMRGKTVLQLDVKRGVGLRKVIRAVERANAESYAGIITYTDQGARIVLESSDDVTVIAGADERSDLDMFARAGATDDRLVIWTGITRGDVDESFVGVLDDRDIAASGGALRYLDERAENGERGLYKELADTGLDIIATDRPLEAAQDLEQARVAAALALCTA
ncbi:MAG: glycerophosphodiester phosphodiesterase family protein [Parvularculaceae bacterium]|nr:glycerophosphodiester phosphodiesterase family protein [Parvularculaceae bacterium]